MLKKCNRFWIFGLLISAPLLFSNIASAQIDPLQGLDINAEKQPQAAPTNVEELEAMLVKTNPLKSFKNLFETSAVSNSTLRTSSFSSIETEHLNPLAIDFVQDYIDSHADALYDLQRTAKPYFDMMDDILVQNGIPKQLKYLAVIESFLKASARSWAGAVGPWQFMPGTARQLGLQVGGFRDERQDYLKSTKAACKYLNYLYNIYGDWLLVIAAYNCGPGRVNSAISRAGTNDFWKLQYHLPAESRNHVKKFIATHYIMEGKGGVTTVTKQKQATIEAPAEPDIATLPENMKVQTIAGRYNSKIIAKYIDMPLEEFLKFNPKLDKILANSNTYQLKLPADKLDLFLQKKNEILNESILILLDPTFKG
ncbi:MAG: lytic transglycosylase domain-containing protein [Niabella sp.]